MLIQQMSPMQNGGGNSIVSPQSIMRRSTMMRKESSCAANTSVLRSYLGISNELMHQAVIRVLNKKRDFAQSEARGGNSATVQSETPNMQNNGSDK